ncbi:MAG: hypothetical protein Q7S03_00225 [bacterium]|nr:hypothetical protein [bacterium]
MRIVAGELVILFVRNFLGKRKKEKGGEETMVGRDPFPEENPQGPVKRPTIVLTDWILIVVTSLTLGWLTFILVHRTNYQVVGYAALIFVVLWTAQLLARSKK